ncbi:MAG: hypothetical protein H6839_17095 [Planctomycetes bacterium]|nr:hypothetical protein [Planctomycetota bacterium]
MKGLPVLMGAVLLLSCSDAPAPEPPPAPKRFEQTWNQAEDWSSALERFHEATTGSGSSTASAMLFWPEFTNRPGLQGAMRTEFVQAWKGASDEEARESVLQVIQARRREDTLERTYRLEGEATPPNNGYDIAGEVCAERAGVWVLAYDLQRRLEDGRSFEGTVTAGEGSRALRISPSSPPDSVKAYRCVFRLLPDPAPVVVYRHGDEVTVGSWGYGLEPVAIELVDNKGNSVLQLFFRRD